MEFTTSGNSSTDTGKVSGNLETKYKCSDYGEELVAFEVAKFDLILDSELM